MGVMEWSGVGTVDSGVVFLVIVVKEHNVGGTTGLP